MTKKKNDGKRHEHNFVVFCQNFLINNYSRDLSCVHVINLRTTKQGMMPNKILVIVTVGFIGNYLTRAVVCSFFEFNTATGATTITNNLSEKCKKNIYIAVLFISGGIIVYAVNVVEY